MLNIVLFGPPGAGKGTQSEKLIASRSLIHLSTGDLFRRSIKNETNYGKKAQAYMDKGELVPDDVVICMVEEKIKNHLDGRGFIFDGFPRTINQAKALDKMLEGYHLSISGMIALEIPEEELKKRIRGRFKVSGRTDDQDEAKIENRIAVHNKETTPVANYYKSQNKFNHIDGMGSIEEVYHKIDAIISNY